MVVGGKQSDGQYRKMGGHAFRGSLHPRMVRMVAHQSRTEEKRRHTTASTGATWAPIGRDPPVPRPGAPRLLRGSGSGLRPDRKNPSGQQARNRDHLPVDGEGRAQGPRRHVREPRRAGGGTCDRLRREGHRMDPVRGGVADAAQDLRARDAEPRQPRRRIRAAAPGDEGHGGTRVRKIGYGHQRRGADVPNGSERDHEHAVGRDAEGQREDEPRVRVSAGGE